jgi:hypothetical protein
MNMKEAANKKDYMGDRTIHNHHCEKVIFYMVKKLFAFYGTQRFISMFTRLCHSSLS